MRFVRIQLEILKHYEINCPDNRELFRISRKEYFQWFLLNDFIALKNETLSSKPYKSCSKQQIFPVVFIA